MTSDPACLLARLLEETRDYLTLHAPTVADFVSDALNADLPLELPTARWLPAVALLPSVSTCSSDITQPLVTALVAAKDVLEWQRSYTETDGFDADYLARYGWFNLVSPEGPYVSDTLRISVGYWGMGLYYKEHWHEPEEYYLVLGGRATFLSEGQVSRDCVPGDIIYHKSNQPHAIDVTPGPLLAMAVWRGKGLVAKPGLPEPQVTHE